MKVLWQMSQTMGEEEGGVDTAAPTAFLVEAGVVVVAAVAMAGVVDGGVKPGRKEERGDGVRDGDGERPAPGDLSTAGLPWGRCGVTALVRMPPGEAGDRMSPGDMPCPGDLEVPGDLPCPDGRCAPPAAPKWSATRRAKVPESSKTDGDWGRRRQQREGRARRATSVCRPTSVFL